MENRTKKNSIAFAKRKMKRVWAILMAILLVVTAVDLNGMQYVSAEGESKVNIIKAFTALPTGTANQQLAVGASESEINRPASLSVTNEVYYVDETQAVSGSVISVNPTYNLTGVTWEIDASHSSAATFNSSAVNTYYTYVPVLPWADSDGNAIRLADGVSLPKIRVEITGTDEASVTEASGTPHLYATVEAAIAAAQGMPDSTVTLLTDVTTESKVTINSGTFTIDLNGKTWTYVSTGSYWMFDQRSSGEITIKNGNTTGGTVVEEAGTLIIDHVNLCNNKNAALEVSNLNNCKLIFNSGSVKVTNALYYAVDIAKIRDSSCTMQINGGTFEGGSNADIRVAQGAILEMKGGEIKGTLEVNVSRAILTGGSYGRIKTYGNIDGLLGDGYGYRFTTEGTPWVTNTAITELSNITVQPVPVQITEQPLGGASATYGYTNAQAPVLHVTAETTGAAPTGSEISYQWYRVKSQSETSDTSVGTNSSTLTIPAGLDAGTHSFYCEVSCDGCIVKSQSAVVTVEKAVPTVTLKVYTREDEPFIYHYGSGIYLNAVVTGVNGEKPDGTVTFMDGDKVLTASNLDIHSNSYCTQSQYPNAGDHSFTAVYNPGTDGTSKNYVSATSAAVQQAIDKADQGTFSFTKVDGMIYGDADFTLDATGGSGTGAVTFSVPANNGVLEINGNKAKIIGAGKVTVTATKAADNNYKNIKAEQEITILQADAPSITYPTAGSITYGHKLSESTLTGGSTEYGTFQWKNAPMVPTADIGKALTVIFTPSAETLKNYKAITSTEASISLDVLKATPAITVNANVSGATGSRKATLTATVTGVNDGEIPTGTVKFINSTGGSDVGIAGATAVTITDGKATFEWTGLADQIYKVKAVYSGSDNYNTATSTDISFDTNKQNQAALTIGNIGTKTYGDGTFTLATTGGSGAGDVTFISSDSTIISIIGTTATIHKAGIVTITATKAADNTYNEASGSVVLTIDKKILTVKADSKGNITKGAVMPNLTYTVTGLVGSDTFTDPTISAVATDTSIVGEYDIIISGGKLTNAGNYVVTYVSGKLTVVNPYTPPIYTPSTGTIVTGNNTAGAPFISGDSSKKGWEAIQGQLETSQEGNKIAIEMNGTTTIPKTVLQSLAGKDTTLVLDLGVGITWSINGQSITASNLNDIDLGVTLDTDAIPAELLSQIAGEQATTTLSLAYDGPFGFTSVLTMDLNKINAGKYGNLFYYNPETKRLTLQAVVKIGEKGTVELPFPHASDYAVIISEEPMLEKALDQITINTLKGTLYVGGTEKKSMTLKLEWPQLLKDAVAKDSSIRKITYQSSNPKVATVTASGKIVAKKAGKTTVTTLVIINGVKRKFETKITVRKVYRKVKAKIKVKVS